MPTELPRTDLALEECRNHLAAIGSSSLVVDTAAIEAYLARHLVVVLCAEVEENVSALIYERIDRSACDEDVKALFKARRKGMIRNASHKEVAETLAQLGDPIRERYVSEVDTAIGERGVWLIGNAVAARDAVAHQTPPGISLGDIEAAFAAAEQMLACARRALS